MCLLTAWLRPGDVAVDVGAHEGSYTRRFAQAVGPTGRVIAVEPDPRTAERWTRMCADLPGATLRRAAVSDGVGSSVLYQGRTSEQSSLWASNLAKVETQAPVETVTLDALLEGVQPRVVKVDAQGAEVHILRGAAKTLATDQLRLMLELWPAGLHAAGTSVQDFATVLETAGYVVVAEGKEPKARAWAWRDLVTSTESWTGQQHTNLIVAKG